jgi:oxalate decarboxylase/phosphoglucose isomerase-like protein (cupin superfamily)
MTTSAAPEPIRTIRDDVRPVGEVRIEKPWGYELHWAITDRYMGKLIHIRAGEALSLQYHERKDESILVLAGLLDLELQDASGEMETHRVAAGVTARVRPRRRHRFVAVEDTDLIEVSSTEIDDVVRLEDRYGREGTDAP